MVLNSLIVDGVHPLGLSGSSLHEINEGVYHDC